MAIELRAGDDSALVEETAGGRLASLVAGGQERIVGYDDDPFMWGCYPMIPWAGRVANARIDNPPIQLQANMGPHAMHGVTYDLIWQIHHQAPNAVELVCPLPVSRWPLGGVAAQRITLSPGRLELEIQVEAGDRPMPVAVGWHPWFRRPAKGDMTVYVATDSVLALTKDLIPTGEVTRVNRKLDLRGAPKLGRRRLDHVYVDVSEPPVVCWPDLELTIELPHKASTVVVHTPERGVCVEPQTAWPDPFVRPERSGLVHLEPREVFTALTRWTWQPR